MPFGQLPSRYRKGQFKLKIDVYSGRVSIRKAQSASLLGAKYFWEITNSSEDVATAA